MMSQLWQWATAQWLARPGLPSFPLELPEFLSELRVIAVRQAVQQSQRERPPLFPAELVFDLFGVRNRHRQKPIAAGGPTAVRGLDRLSAVSVSGLVAGSSDRLIQVTG